MSVLLDELLTVSAALPSETLPVPLSPETVSPKPLRSRLPLVRVTVPPGIAPETPCRRVPPLTVVVPV
ncbi:MAG: hypothetical protein U0930_12845 [Pirellulales bacterium]